MELEENTGSGPTRGVEGSLACIQREVERHALHARGEVGVAAWVTADRGPCVMMNADKLFPMASTRKVAIACDVLRRVGAGALNLAQIVHVREDLFRPGSILADRFRHGQVAVSLYNLIELMLCESDGTSTDVLLDMVGGPRAVTDALQRWGIAEQHLDRDTKAILCSFFNVSAEDPISSLRAISESPDRLAIALRCRPEWESEPLDVTTPRAMTSLLSKAFRGEILSPSSTQILREAMQHCRTGRNRIRGLLPDGVEVADKTGSLGGITADVGMIALPEDAGDLFLSIYIAKSRADLPERELVIAHIARTLYDFYALSRN